MERSNPTALFLVLSTLKGIASCPSCQAGVMHLILCCSKTGQRSSLDETLYRTEITQTLTEGAFSKPARSKR
jgi:hypothetical protein